MLSYGRHTAAIRMCVCVSVCRVTAETHTHTVTNTAVRAFDVQGAVSVVHVCPLKSFPALGVKHGNKGK